MSHTFFKQNKNYTVEETFKVDQFTIEIAFANDDTQLDLLFDTDMEGYDELIENLDSGFWQHMICRVQAKYDDRVMGEAHLGSIVAESGGIWMFGAKPQIDDLVDEAVDEARTEAVRMLEILKKDFLGVDI